MDASELEALGLYDPADVGKAAHPSEVVATTDVAESAGLPYRSRGRHELKGIAGAVELAVVSNEAKE